MRYVYVAYGRFVEYLWSRKGWVIYDALLYGFALYGLYAGVFA